VKSDSSSSSSSGGIGFAGLLTIVFITLKLLGYITWSWWWVLSPIWISILLTIAAIVIVAIVLIVMELMKGG
jgi:uncharacterized protein (DUF983 family)